MNTAEISSIIEMKKSGMSFRDIKDKTGYSIATIVKYCKGITSQKDGCRNRVNKKLPLSEETRKKLSEAAKKRILKTKKVWTSLEQKMFYKFLENGFVIKFNKNIEETIYKNIYIFDYDIIFQGEIQRYCVDFLDEKNKICYEINGNYWHANPIIYKDNLTECQKWNVYRDKNKIKYLESKGYKVIIIWEDEIDSYVLENKQKEISKEYINYIESCISGINMSQNKNKYKIKIQKEMPKCVDCGNILKTNKAKRCIECNKIFCRNLSEKQMKFIISKEDLEKDIKNMSFVAIGKKYGVSDNSIRKRCKRLGITRDSYNG